MIEVKKVSKSFDGGASYAVKEVSLNVPEGKTLVLLGASGSGKTSLLRMINRLIEPSAGEIHLDGKDIRAYDPIELRHTIGYAFQGVGLFPHMTVKQNITIALKLMGHSRKERRQRANELLQVVNLAPAIFGDRYPDELSGGQQQRVGVARALATHPKYLLMDEPFGALDPINREAMQEELVSLRERFSTTILFVTHDIFEAIHLGDTIAVLRKGQVEQIGSAGQLFRKPASEYVKHLFHKPFNQLNRCLEEVS